MEKRKNLYKLDDICLVLSVILFIVFLVQFRSLLPLFTGSDLAPVIEEAKYLVLGAPLKMGLLLFSAVFFQIIGRVVRTKEKISLEVIEALSYRSRASVSSLATEMGRDLEKIEKIAKQLAAIPGAGVTFDGTYLKIDRGQPDDQFKSKYDRDFDRVVKEEIPMAEHPYRDETGNTPEKSTEKNNSRTEDFSNRYPEDFPEELINAGVKPGDIKQNIKQEFIKASKSPQYKSNSGKLRPNPIIVIFLMIAFWPAAIIYLVSFYIKNAQKNAIKNGLEKR